MEDEKVEKGCDCPICQWIDGIDFNEIGMAIYGDSFKSERELSVGAALLYLLAKRGWSVSDLANKMDRSREHVGRLLSGAIGLSSDDANVLGVIFDVTPDFWVKQEENYINALKSEFEKLGD